MVSEVLMFPPRNHASHDFFKQILKLRWIGRGPEAERMLQTALRETSVWDERERW